MIDKELEVLAFENAPLPYLDNALDKAAYLAVRSIYQQFKSGTISKEQAAAEKKILYRQIELFQDEHKFEIAWINSTAKRIRTLQTVTSAYGREKTQANAEALWRAVQGLL